MKVKLTAPWRNHPQGAILDVTPGQRAMILSLQKGRDHNPAMARPAATEKPEPDKKKAK